MDIVMDMKLFALEIPLTTEIVNLIAELDEFKGRWTATHALAPERLAALKQVATIESVGSSTRIEGVKLSNVEVEALLRSVKTYSFRSRDEQEVAGYAEIMELIFSSFAEIPLSEKYVKQLHGVLLKHSSKDERHRGEYKKLPNSVEAFDASGKSLGVIFETTSPFDTPKSMAELVGWTNAELQEKKLHPLLVISILVVVFLKIHPFQDGNGRLSRALTTLLLLRHGYSYVPYSSMERVIEENKDNYYLALRRAQTSLGKKDSGIGEWIVFFLQCMQKQKAALEKKLKDEVLFAKLPELSLQIIELVKQRGSASVLEVVIATRANRNTVKAHFKALVASGHLVQDGAGRGSRYRQRFDGS
ncbi:MAG: Fic family protein [Bdellovibrionota bacterium]